MSVNELLLKMFRATLILLKSLFIGYPLWQTLFTGSKPNIQTFTIKKVRPGTFISETMVQSVKTWQDLQTYFPSG